MTEKAQNGNHSSNASPGGKFLTFFLSDEEYGLEILKVHEIIGVVPITPVPRTPEHVRGVINLRGKVIPVVDLRRKFGLPAQDDGRQTCIIVIESQRGKTGVVVDRVSEVVEIEANQIDQAPSFGSDIATDYILGVGRPDGEVKLLLDIEKALSAPDVRRPMARNGSSGDESHV
ncbi:MAG TPA: chemotaxis protein CheW [Acidobacteriota bacterium]|nr:chemotaxis protein CheW [Acidobacteriota bacterium]